LKAWYHHPFPQPALMLFSNGRILTAAGITLTSHRHMAPGTRWPLSGLTKARSVVGRQTPRQTGSRPTVRPSRLARISGIVVAEHPVGFLNACSVASAARTRYLLHSDIHYSGASPCHSVKG
jgi:hypothetical protein